MLHVTAHLGGGVGKVLSRLVSTPVHGENEIRHTIACLEQPEKSQFVDHICAHGGQIVVCPSAEELFRLAEEADIVQLEWWHHPVLAAWMGAGQFPASRWLIWSHISGTYVPHLPRAFVSLPGRFLFTSPCCWQNLALLDLSNAERARVDVVFSSGGFDDLPEPPVRPSKTSLSFGYVGTSNLAKLHPQLVDFLAAVEQADFRLAMIGDTTSAELLLQQAREKQIEDRLEICGYRNDVVQALLGFDVLVYLLNPQHYGTAENALLEAMAMGVVPIVLANPAEQHLVRHEVTGLVVKDPGSFAQAVRRLSEDDELRARLSRQAAEDIRQRFAAENTVQALAKHYHALMDEPKSHVDFLSVWGQTPADWFRAAQGGEAYRFRDDGSVDTDTPVPHVLLERTKGSVFHFQSFFPDDARLAAWAKALESWI